MKAAIQPNYTASKIICACGNVMETNSTKQEMKVGSAVTVFGSKHLGTIEASLIIVNK